MSNVEEVLEPTPEAPKSKRELKKEYFKAWYAKNREYNLARVAHYKKERRVELGPEQKKRNFDSARSVRGRYSQLKATAKRNNRTCLITFEQYEILANKACYYCGGKLPEAGFGLDRVDSCRGYEIDNVRPCCKDCNIAKNAMSEAAFREWTDRVHENYGISVLRQQLQFAFSIIRTVGALITSAANLYFVWRILHK